MVELQRLSEAERASASVEEVDGTEGQTDNVDLLEGDGGDEEDDHWEHDAAWVQAFISAGDEDSVQEAAAASSGGEESAEEDGEGLQAHEETRRRRSWAPIVGGPSSRDERDSTREDLFDQQLRELEGGTMHEDVIWKVHRPAYVTEE